jgi:hypothetical protein
VLKELSQSGLSGLAWIAVATSKVSVVALPSVNNPVNNPVNNLSWNASEMAQKKPVRRRAFELG